MKPRPQPTKEPTSQPTLSPTVTPDFVLVQWTRIALSGLSILASLDRPASVEDSLYSPFDCGLLLAFGESSVGEEEFLWCEFVTSRLLEMRLPFNHDVADFR